VPQRQAASWRGQPGVELKDLPKLENDARTTLLQGLGGLVLLSGLGFTLWNLRLTQDRQITEYYTRAVEQLGSDKLEVRLGAIYALERIARDSERDHWPIMEILIACVREHAPWPQEAIPLLADDLSPTEKSPEGKDQPAPKPALDIQAILTVLGRRTRYFGKGEAQRIDLSRTTLRGAYLREAHLERAAFWHAHLEGAYLRYTHLEGAVFWQAHLERAALQHAHLEGANLWEAHLEGANLLSAHLQGAEDLTVEQLSTVETLYRAELDPPLLAQIQQRYPHLREKPQPSGTLDLTGPIPIFRR
jgi:Pentapeptide repeats (8 copies)